MYLSCKFPHPAQLCVPRQGRPCQADRLVLAFCLITCIVNSINCVWVAVAGLLVPDFIYNIGTTVLNGGISMLIFFFVNKIIFPEREAKKYRNNFRYCAQKPSAVKREPFCMQV